MERPSLSFFIMIFVLLFAFIGFIFVVFDLRGLSFIFELGVLLTFMFLLTFTMFFVFSNKRGSWGIIAAVLLLIIFNVFVIFLLTKNFSLAYVVSTLFSVAGIIVAVLNGVWMRKVYVEGENGKYYYPFLDKVEPKEESKIEAKSESKVQKTFTPGKYVASKKANKFHSPKCDWASRISKENHVWFDSKEEAQSKGFEADKCVE